MRKETFLLFAILSFLISACNNTERKATLEHLVSISVDTSSHIFDPDELLTIHNNDFSAFKKNFDDSTIFIMGDIQHIDEEHGEILLRNSYEGNNLICLVKDSTVLTLLKRSDKVLFKGVCKGVSGNGLVLISDCELAQLTAVPPNK